MSEPLEPCPFCGSTQIQFREGDRYGSCHECDAQSPRFSAVGDMKENAIAAWNRRAPSERERLAEVESLRKERDSWKIAAETHAGWAKVVKDLKAQISALSESLRVAREDMRNDLTYRNDCSEHFTADCEVPGCEDPDDCVRCLVMQRIASLNAALSPAPSAKEGA